MDKKRRIHKQSKYFTIMLVPDATSSTVKSIRIAHWVFKAAAMTVCTIVVVVLALMTRTAYADLKMRDVSKTLEHSVQEKEELEQEMHNLENQKTEIANEKSLIENSYDQQQSVFDAQIDAFKEAIEEAEQRIEELEDSKEELYDRISSHSASPIQQKALYRTSLLSAPPITDAGGPDNTNELVSMIALLNQKIDNEYSEYESLAKDIETYAKFKETFPNSWPVRGRITSEEGYRTNPFGGSSGEYHNGMDIAVPTGTSVRAAGAGKVIKAEYYGGYGNIVIIDHGYGIHSYYGHNSALHVSVGQIVKRGEVVARSGSTGRSTGPHVHFEVRVNDVVKNPRDFLEEVL